MNTISCPHDQAASISGMRELFERWLVEVGQDEQRASKDYAAFDLFLAGALAMLPADQREAVKAEYARQEFWKSFRRIRAIKSQYPGYNPKKALSNMLRNIAVPLHPSDVEHFERTYRSPSLSEDVFNRTATEAALAAEEDVRSAMQPEQDSWDRLYKDDSSTHFADAMAYTHLMEQRPDPSKIYGRGAHLLILDDPLRDFGNATVNADDLPKQTREEILQHVKHLNTVMPHIAHGVNKDEDK